MKPNKQAKWIVGITGTALSAFILSQLNTNTNATSNNQTSQQVSYQTEVPTVKQKGLSNREKELAKKDWSNFTVDSNTEKKSTAVASNKSTEKSTNQSTDTVKKSITNKPAAQPSQPASQSNTNTTVNQPVVQQQPINPPTDRNTSRS